MLGLNHDWNLPIVVPYLPLATSLHLHVRFMYRKSQISPTPRLAPISPTLEPQRHLIRCWLLTISTTLHNRP
jgi:hypothetical protein